MVCTFCFEYDISIVNYGFNSVSASMDITQAWAASFLKASFEPFSKA